MYYNYICVFLILCFIVAGSRTSISENFWFLRTRRYNPYHHSYYPSWYGRYNPFHTYIQKRHLRRYCPSGCVPSGSGYKCLDPLASCPIGAVGCCQYDYDCTYC